MVKYVVIFVCIYLGAHTLLKVVSRDPLSEKTFHKLALRRRLVESAARAVRINPKTADDLKEKLQRIDSGMTPQEYIAEGLLKAVPMLGISALLFINGSPFLGLYAILLAYLFHRQHMKRLTKKAQKVDRLILDDLPEFMSYVTNSLKTDKNVGPIIENYLSAANPALKRELLKLLADLKTGNIDEALLNFDIRLNVPHLSNFISAIRATLEGEMQSSALDAITIDMEFYEYETAKRYAAEKPGKMGVATIAVVVSMIIFILVILFCALYTGLNKMI